jgi:thiol-disulfide isomerase/thioredoxin
MRILNFLRTATVLAGALMAISQTPAATLSIGDPAPALQVARWVQGEPVQSFDSNHVYIVEFWATWCGPCRASIPHLNKIWQDYKDKGLIVIGQDCWEQDEGGVPAFVKKMDDQMTYRVALDDKSQEKDGAMAINWMKAAGQNGIPTAFVVNRQGKIAWIGHPMTLEDSVLDQILADKFDMAAYAQEFAKRHQQQEQQRVLSTKLQKALQAKDWEAADATLTEIETALPENARFQVDAARVRILLGQKKYAAAYKLAESTSNARPSNISLLNQLAWYLTTAPGVDQVGLALAERLAGEANAGAKGKVPAILDTLARAQFLLGETNQAVANEQKALDSAPEEIRANLNKSLNDYQQGKLPEVNE